VLVPLVLVLIALSLYPQIALKRSEPAVEGAIAPTQQPAGEVAQP
jgi:hypothetical protein